jgi:signal transduction histidine kinase
MLARAADPARSLSAPADPLAIEAQVLRRVQHELRTPLTSIVGFAEHIAAHPKAAQTAEFAALIATAGRQLNGAVADLIAAAELLGGDVALRLDECAPAQLLDAALAAEAALAEERGVDVRLHDRSGARQLECDRDLITRALKNLLRNAIQHGEGPVELMAAEARGAIEFVVRDRGRGFDAAADPQGLGLLVARRAFDAHGGGLTVSYLEGVGCVVIGTLPIHQSASGSRDCARGPGGASSSR